MPQTAHTGMGREYIYKWLENMPSETATCNEKILTLNDEEKLRTFPMSDCSEGKQKVVHLPLWRRHGQREQKLRNPSRGKISDEI